MNKKNSLLSITLSIALGIANAQSYTTSFKAEICNCLPQQFETQKNPNKAIETCFQNTLPNYAALIDAEIVEENANIRYQKGQQKRMELMVSFTYEMVNSCDIYFNKIEEIRELQFNQGKAYITEAKIVELDKLVAMHPNHGTYLERGRANFYLENYSKAEIDVRESIRIYKEMTQQENIAAIYLLAWILEKQERYQKAFQLLDEEYKERPIFNTAYFREIANKKTGGSFKPLKNASNRRIKQDTSKLKNIKKNASKDDLKKLFKIKGNNKI
ncbi:hypothetical protein ULMS_07120 [Patiriisocius marinistellae]|uniref:Tetratricopeptide repeat protein n=1 Tax=Patiriisocius marinistellae TaxID=2494560 RepID=A0A5J4FVQ0_9FLAO|nr:tetratricopeptide repeat protein [Patiriisocius marinistellae]GEQ85204.1 hypothetical protein ULMS_07120 [Patiriisocius marinistellae]